MTILYTWPPQWPEIESAIQESLASGDWGSYFSQAHSQLSHGLAEKFGAKFVRLCCSGTAAVEMALRASGLAPGDEVLTAAFDYPGNIRCIEAVGAVPVLLDVKPLSVGMDVDQIASAPGKKIRAVIVSHLYGHAADVVAIRKICDARGWTLIEDACQAPGMSIASVDGPELDGRRLAGSFGHVSTLSFGGSKPLTAGNGGAILTSDERVHARLKRLYDRPSDALPLSALQAAVLVPQLSRLDELNQIRSATATLLSTFLQVKLPSWSPVDFRFNHDDLRGAIENSCFYKFAFLAQSAEHRTRIIDQAKQCGIPIGEGFRSMHRMSDARCRKPFSLNSAAEIGERCCVLDHRALMIKPSRHAELCELICQIHDLSQ